MDDVIIAGDPEHVTRQLLELRERDRPVRHAGPDRSRLGRPRSVDSQSRIVRPRSRPGIQQGNRCGIAHRQTRESSVISTHINSMRQSSAPGRSSWAPESRFSDPTVTEALARSCRFRLDRHGTQRDHDRGDARSLDRGASRRGGVDRADPEQRRRLGQARARLRGRGDHPAASVLGAGSGRIRFRLSLPAAGNARIRTSAADAVWTARASRSICNRRIATSS